MAGYCSTGQSPQRAVVLMEEEVEMFTVYARIMFKNIFYFSLRKPPRLLFERHRIKLGNAANVNSRII
jgi:hypothetical protein